MCRGINKVILVGNVGQEIEGPEGVAQVRLATTETWKDKNSGEQVEKTEWHNVVAFGKISEILKEHVNKGDKLYIEGRLEYRSWDKDDGSKGYATDIVVRDFCFL